MKTSSPLLLLIILLLISCKKQNHHNHNKTDTVISSNNQTIKPRKFSPITAFGSEPNWNIVISKKTNSNFIFKLTTQLGSKVTTGSVTLKNTISKKNNLTTYFKGYDDFGKEITILYTNTPCLDMAGNELPGALQINWNHQVLYGCTKKMLE